MILRECKSEGVERMLLRECKSEGVRENVIEKVCESGSM